MLIDSHCHLDCLETPVQALENARKAGIERFLTIGVRPSDIQSRLAFVQDHPDVVMSVGFHPCYAGEESVLSAQELYMLLRDVASEQRVVAIGETGLDLMEGSPPLEMQVAAFSVQMRVALHEDVPVIIHMRGAEAETEALFDAFIQEHGALPKHVFHCFTGSEAFARRAIDRGALISFSGILTFPKATDLHAIAKALPLTSLLLETDAPWLAPVPYRGRKNEPAYLVETARYLAQLRGISVKEVAAQTTSNFYRLFTKVSAS